MIGILAGGDVREQAGTGQPFVDDGDRRMADGDVIAALGAGVLETHVLIHEQMTRMIIELLADIFAELLSDGVAARTNTLGFGQGVLDADALKILRQFLAAAVASAFRGVLAFIGRRCFFAWCLLGRGR
jgi:hypothetical protein